jgi:hypothetical protein
MRATASFCACCTAIAFGAFATQAQDNSVSIDPYISQATTVNALQIRQNHLETIANALNAALPAAPGESKAWGSFTVQTGAYSVNIVGYVNVSTTGGKLHLLNNPLDDGSNTLNSAMTGAPTGSEAYVWNGAGYTPAAVGAKTGVWSPDASIPTGVGFFFKPSANFTNTFVGEVLAGPGECVTNKLAGGLVDLTGSLLPYATASIATDSIFALNNAPPGSKLFKWDFAGQTYIPAGVGAKTGAWSPDLGMDVAEGFFIIPSSGFKWIQCLP